MSAPPHNDTQQPGVFSGSTQTSVSRAPASSRDLRASKRVCFYKSGDPQFSGHRIVINSRTFKTFDALLDALSKKVPLPFGVRTITTPKGTHIVHSLDDLRDGASYVCSDQRRVKPLNLDEVNRRQVPWNTTRPTSSGRQGRRGLIRQLVKRNEVVRTTKVNNAVAVWTPKRLVVFKNRDPSTKRMVVLQRRTAPTFEALLDYLSQVLQFPVVKLYTADGRRVDGLPALILCSGMVVAAGNEPFRLGNYNFQGPPQQSQSAISESIGPAKTHHLPQDGKKSGGSRSRSRNFSLSSERYLVNQINKSLNGSVSEDNGQKTGSVHTENNQRLGSEEMETSDFIADVEEKDHFIMPSEDDIEKSFCVNQDGSMTVEMKVRLTLKQEEMIHWTTTLSRTCADGQQRAVCSRPGYSPYSNTNPATEAKGDGYESKENNTPTEKSAGLNEEGEDPCGSATSETLEKPKPAFRRLPTPGPRRVRRKEASVENIKRVSQNELQESTVGAYSYMERTAEGELTEGYCVVSRSSSSSTRPVPKPRKNSSGEAKHKKTQSSIRSSRMAEVLQLQNNGTEITETVMRIYESQGTYENYFANTQVTGDERLKFRAEAKEPRNPDSTDSGPRSSSNECDVDLTRQSTSSNSQNARKNELLSLSSGQSSPSQKISNNLSSGKNNEKQARPESSDKGLLDLEAGTKEKQKHKGTANRKSIMTPKSVKSTEGSTSDTTVSDKKQKHSVTDSFKDLRKSKSPESQSHAGSEKKTVSSTESDRHAQKPKKKNKDKLSGSQKSQSPNLNFGDQKGSSEKNLNLDDPTTHKSPKKVNIRDSNPPRDSQTETLRSPVKKKLLNVLPASHFKMLAKHKSMNECRTKSPKASRELSESVSMPVLQSAPSNVHQYVENWLKKIQPESVPYIDEMDPHEAETEARAKFWIGSGSPDSSEIRSEPEKDSIVKECTSLEDTTTERPLSRPPVQIRCEGEPVEAQRIRGFCKSMPSVRIYPAEQESRIRMNKSSEALVPTQTEAQGETSQSTNVTTKSGMKPVLQQLCLSIQSIRRTTSHSHLTPLEKEKSTSLPDFSSQVTSVFGAPSKALLSFLSVMTLKDGVSSTTNEDPVGNSGSYPEALQVMQSLEKIASIEDEEELKASLTSLQSSTSSQLKKSWRDFQERNDVDGSPPLSPRLSEQEFALEVDSEGEGEDKEHRFGIEELMDELNMPEELRREISSIVDGEPTNSDTPIPTNTATEVASESKDASTKDSFLEPEGFSEERASDDDNITRVENTECDETYKVESCPPDPALPSKDLVMEKSAIVENVQSVEDETSRTGLVLDERDIVQGTEEQCTENAACHVDDLEVPDYTQNNLEEEEKEEIIACVHLKSECSHMSETDKADTETKEDDEKDQGTRDEHNMNAKEAKDYTFDNTKGYEVGENQEAELQNSAVTQEEGCSLNEEVEYEEEQNNDIFNSEYAESQHQGPGIVNCDFESHNSNDSETGNEMLAVESPRDEHGHNISIEEESRSEALECSVDDADPDANNNSSMEEQGDDKHEDTVSKASEYEDPDAKSYHSSISDQDSEQTDKTRTGSRTSQGSEVKHGLQTLEKEDVLETHCSAEEKDEEAGEDKWSNALDSDKDADAEPNSPAMSGQDSEHSERDKTLAYKSQESEAEQELQPLEEEEEEEVTEEEDKEADELEDKLSNASESDKDCDAGQEPNCSTMLDQDDEPSDQDKTLSCESQESEAEQELQTLEEEEVTEEKDEDADEYEEKQSIAVDSDKDFDAEPEPNYPATSEQDGEHSDHSKSQSYQSQESEAEQSLKENDIIERQISSAEEKDEDPDDHEDKQSSVLDSDEDFDAGPIYPARSEEGEPNKSESCKSQESEPEQELQPLEEEEEEGTEEEDKEADELEDKLSNASESDKDFDAGQERNCPAMFDQDDEHSDQDKTLSCKSQESEAEQELQMSEEVEVAEEKDEEADEHGDKQSNTSESDDAGQEANCSAILDQHGEPSDQNQSCKSQESEDEHDFQTLDENDVIQKELGSAEEKYDEADKQSSALDPDEEFDAEQNYPATSDQEDKDSERDKTESCCSQDLQEEENVTEGKAGKANDHMNKQSNVLDSDNDFDTEPDCPTVSDQEGELFDQDKICKSQESGHQIKEQESFTGEKQTSSAEDIDDEHVDSNALDSGKDVEAQSNHSYMPDTETKPPLRGESCNSQNTEANIAHSEDTEGVEDGEGCNFVYPMEISQDLLDFVNYALLSSALTFTYDSNGHLRIEADRCKIRDMSLTEHIVNNQYIQGRLPSPNTSDLSDYRPETSDSGGDASQVSTDLYTETGEEEVERLSVYQGIMKPGPKICKKRDKALGNSSAKTNSRTDTKSTAHPGFKSTKSLASFHDSIANGAIQEPAYSSTSGSFNEDSEPVQRIVFHSEADSGEGILIDKGRWLLKENHLIRNSPPVSMGMYENADTTSADTGQDNTSDDAPYPPNGCQHSPLAVISSSELEEMAKPPTPKCTYFNMPHSSDSDPFLDRHSTSSSKGGGDIRKSRELKVSPMGETSKTWAKKNGSLPSFASVEFKLPDGKVHPEAGLASGAVEKAARSQSISSRAAQEEESVEGLNLRCGRHCPIL